MISRYLIFGIYNLEFIIVSNRTASFADGPSIADRLVQVVGYSDCHVCLVDGRQICDWLVSVDATLWMPASP